MGSEGQGGVEIEGVGIEGVGGARAIARPRGRPTGSRAGRRRGRFGLVNVSEVRQRWRLVFSRGEEARFLSHLDAVRLWERAFRRGEIPVATSEGFSPRPKLIFAAPLPLGMLAEHELADLYLAERLTAPDLRDRLAAGMPSGYLVSDLHDIWIGAPAIAPQLAAADYRMTLLNVAEAGLGEAAARLMAAERLPRERRKEARLIRYDLRPLLLDLQVRPADPEAAPPDAAPADAGPMSATGLWMRLRHSQDGGSGRPDEVVAALAGELGLAANVAVGDGEQAESAGSIDLPGASAETGGRPALEVVRPVRERLLLVDEL
jgi:radical SAM-linked protein